MAEVLARIETGEGGGPHPPLVIAHGLFGAARNWGTVAKRIAATGRRVIAVDMRNHGESPNRSEMSYADMADDLSAVLEGLGKADLLGHSMGGKAAMALALRAPPALRRLVVADIAPVAYAHSHAGHVAAMAALDLGAVTRRSDADRMLAEGVPDRALRAFLLQSLSIGDGRAEWRLNLPALDAAMPALVGWGETGVWEGPALFLRGGASDYVGAAHVPAVRAQFPAAAVATIPGVGHWLHAEAPGSFAEAVTAFLDQPIG